MQDFLAALWSPRTGYGEIRAIPRPQGPPVFQSFIPLNDPAALKIAVETARNYDHPGRDVYFGVLRRDLRSGRNEDVHSTARVLWADVDANKEGSLAGLLQFPVSPSIIVDSGHGYHAYWLLSTATPVADLRLAMQGMAKDIPGADHTYDAARVLRLPGTVNRKGDEHLPVRLLKMDTLTRYRFSDFSEWADKNEQAGTPYTWNRGGPPTEPMDLPDWLNELIVKGAPKGARSEACFKVAIWLMRYGYGDEGIRTIFQTFPFGIGAKYFDKGRDGDRWLATTLRSAHEVEDR